MKVKKQNKIKREIYGRSPFYDAMDDLKNLIPKDPKSIKRKGFKFIKEFPKLEPIVSMIEFKGRIIVATAKRIYELKEDKIIPIKIRIED